MAKENVNLDSRLKKKKQKKVFRILNYFEHFVNFVFAVSGCVLISPFASLLGVSVAIASSSAGWETFALTAGIKKCKSIIN